MRVYFLQDAEPYGRKGEIKEVADGFARNYLIRRGIVVEVTESLLNHLREINRQKEEKEKRILRRAEDEAKRINGKTLEFRLASKDGKKLYGSLRASEIEERIKNKYEPKVPFEVKLDEPIKEVGRYEVEVVFFGRSRAKIYVIISPQS